ncbi:MAG: SUMF1/EgtB/PvdO family nonheme iron enzyme, partial [Candidatus Poribacteria bacterium]|nr:SUMF1/EgtB/PvdO family nonheme iron enzyme [Candidatus Poribacteria bacterium]
MRLRTFIITLSELIDFSKREHISVCISLYSTLFLLIAMAACGKGEVIQRSLDGSTQAPIEGAAPAGMVLIPAGTFQMGSYDPGSDDSEQPLHTVYVDAFYMDSTEVTKAQFKAFVLENPQWRKDRIRKRFHTGDYLYDWNGNNYPDGEAAYPVTYVSWYAAMAYSKWAGKRLPTEAEWEYAARGGLVGKVYPYGNTITPHDANYGSNVGGPRAVGCYPVNGYGLYDMAGN